MVDLYIQTSMTGRGRWWWQQRQRQQQERQHRELRSKGGRACSAASLVRSAGEGRLRTAPVVGSSSRPCRAGRGGFGVPSSAPSQASASELWLRLAQPQQPGHLAKGSKLHVQYCTHMHTHRHTTPTCVDLTLYLSRASAWPVAASMTMPCPSRPTMRCSTPMNAPLAARQGQRSTGEKGGCEGEARVHVCVWWWVGGVWVEGAFMMGEADVPVVGQGLGSHVASTSRPPT